jgi:hypothetical protein
MAHTYQSLDDPTQPCPQRKPSLIFALAFLLAAFQTQILTILDEIRIGQCKGVPTTPVPFRSIRS